MSSKKKEGLRLILKYQVFVFDMKKLEKDKTHLPPLPGYSLSWNSFRLYPAQPVQSLFFLDDVSVWSACNDSSKM